MVHGMHSLAATIPQSSMRSGQPFSMTTPQDLARLTASDDASARRAAVKLFLRTGDYDPKFPDWPGNTIERETKGMDEMLGGIRLGQVARVEKEPELVEGTVPSQNPLHVGGQSCGAG